MNDPLRRRRILLLCVVGAFLLLGLVFVSLFAPSAHPGETSPVLRPGQSTDIPASATTGTGSAAFHLGGSQLVSLAWRLGLVIIIIAISVAGLRWWGRKTSGPRSATGFLRVVDTLAISSGRSIHLVALGERVIAIGATDHQVSLLADLGEEESAVVLSTSDSQAGQSLTGFAAELLQSMKRTGISTHGRERTNEPAVPSTDR